jgi:Tfp pilus assembly protein PilV
MIQVSHKLEEHKGVGRVTDGVALQSAMEVDQHENQSGFSLLEATIALLLMMIVALGSASLFSFSIYNNSGGSDRATSIAIAQEALERLRSAQFNSTTTDPSLNGGPTSNSPRRTNLCAGYVH